MSVANTLVTADAAYLVTDGGWTDLASRRLLDIKDKVFEVSGTSTVLTALGGAWVAPYLHMDAEQQSYQTYDDVIAGLIGRLPDTIREVHEQVPGAPRHWGEFAIVVVGWQDGPRAHLVYVNDAGAAVPRVNKRAAPNFKAIPCAENLYQSDIEGSAVRLLEAQRAVETPEGVVATGFVQLTTVGPKGVSRKVLHRWPDRVGAIPQR